jgi:hypothetical protein
MESNQQVLNDVNVINRWFNLKKKLFFLFLKESMTEILKVNPEFYFILRILGVIFLLLIVYITSCEMIRYSLIKFENLPEDVSFKYIENKR